MTSNVAIDNDFLSHLVEITGITDLFSLIENFFNAMGVSVEMHPLVYENETKPNQKEISCKLFADKVINISDFGLIVNNKYKKQYYEIMIKQVYYDFTGKKYPCEDICNEWKSRDSLGEVHTVIYCAMIGYDCFLSDDKDASKNLGNIIANRMSKRIDVKNRQDCCEYIKQHSENTHNLKSRDFKVIAHKRT